MPKYKINIKDIDPVTATITIVAENKAQVLKMINDEGLNSILLDQSSMPLKTSVVWDDDFHQADWNIVGEIKEVSNEKVK